MLANSLIVLPFPSEDVPATTASHDEHGAESEIENVRLANGQKLPMPIRVTNPLFNLNIHSTM
jgi:hypothetical protein